MPCSRPSFPPTGPLGPQPRGRCRQVQETCGGCEGLGSRGPGRAPEGRALWSPGSPGSGPSQARRAEVVQNKAQPQGVHVLGGPWEGLHLVWIQEGALLRLHRPAGGQPPWLRDSDKALKTQGPGAPGGRDRGCHGTLSRGPSRLCPVASVGLTRCQIVSVLLKAPRRSKLSGQSPGPFLRGAFWSGNPILQNSGHP